MLKLIYLLLALQPIMTQFKGCLGMSKYARCSMDPKSECVDGVCIKCSKGNYGFNCGFKFYTQADIIVTLPTDKATCISQIQQIASFTLNKYDKITALMAKQYYDSFVKCEGFLLTELGLSNLAMYQDFISNTLNSMLNGVDTQQNPILQDVKELYLQMALTAQASLYR